MKKIKKTVSIGIPAYNEEANIQPLLQAILKQEQTTYVLKEIIVVSDASTDGTVSKTREIKSKKIKLISLKKRVGVNIAQNKILKVSTGDILVLFNADVIPAKNDFIEKIVKPIQNDTSIHYVGANSIPVKAKTYIEKLLNSSHSLKQYMFEQINKGNNLYTCNGKARALSKKFYKNLVWADNCPEDAYSYVVCVTKGYRFVYAKNAYVYFRSPSNLSDYIKQTNRFIYGKKKLEESFPKELLVCLYAIPLHVLVKALVRFFFINPSSTVAYLALNLFVSIAHKIEPQHHSRYEVVTSSKKLLYFL